MVMVQRSVTALKPKLLLFWQGENMLPVLAYKEQIGLYRYWFWIGRFKNWSSFSVVMKVNKIGN